VNTPASVLDAVCPPHGYRFAAGVWLTHDLAVSSVNDLLLPALSGMHATERGLRRAAPGDIDPGALLICAAADRINAQGLLPDAVRVLPVAGRRQHAKAAVLHYLRSGPTSLGPAALTLTLVTSANITAGGLTRNRELVVIQTVGSDTKGTALVPELLASFRGVRKDLPSHARTWLDAQLTMLTQLTNGSVRSTESISHSIDEARAASFAEGFGATPVGRILLVGPAFAADTSDVASLLDPLIGTSTVVDLVVGSRRTAAQLHRGTGTVEVPTGLLVGLRERSDHVTVRAIPASDSVAEMGRVLHGKTILVQQGETFTQMAGSANLTLRGLGGRNRELIVFIDRADLSSIDHELKKLGAIEVKERSITAPVDGPPLSDLIDPSAAPLLAVFVPDPGQNAGNASLTGTLDVTGTGQSPSFIVIDGHRIRLTNGQTHVTLSGGSVITATVSRRLRDILVTLTPREGRAFWTSIPGDVRPRDNDPMLTRLLSDVDRATRRGSNTPPEPNGQTAANPSAPSSDGFALPGKMRLNVVARYRDHFAQYERDRAQEFLRALFPDPVEREVAKVVLDAARATSNEARGPVLAALYAAIADLGGNEQ
jgi:hypothetical protein